MFMRFVAFEPLLIVGVVMTHGTRAIANSHGCSWLKIRGDDTRTFKSTPVARERRLRPLRGSPAVPTLGLGPGATECPTSEQGATLVAHIYIVNTIKIAHPCTAVDGV